MRVAALPIYVGFGVGSVLVGVLRVGILEWGWFM